MNIKATIFFLFIVCLMTCSINCQSNKETQEALKAKDLLLLVETKQNNLNGNLVLFDIEHNKKLKIMSNIFALTHPRITSDRKYLMYFKNSIPTYSPVFCLYDLEHDAEKLIDLRKKLPPETASLDGLLGFEFLNDSSIVFNYKDKLYKYNFISNSMILLKDLKNRKIMEMCVDKKGMKIAMSYQIGLDSMNYTKFAVYDLKKDSIFYFDQKLYEISSNWNPDGTEIMIYNDTDSLIFFNYNDKTFISYDKTKFAPGIYTGKTIFITNDTVIFNECMPNYNLYYYDLKSRKLIRKLTNDNLERQSSDFSKIELSNY